MEEGYLCSVTINITPNSPPLIPYTSLHFYSQSSVVSFLLPFISSSFINSYIFSALRCGKTHKGICVPSSAETRGWDETCIISWSKDMGVPFCALMSLRLHVDFSLLSSSIPYCIPYRAVLYNRPSLKKERNIVTCNISLFNPPPKQKVQKCPESFSIPSHFLNLLLTPFAGSAGLIYISYSPLERFIPVRNHFANSRC